MKFKEKDDLDYNLYQLKLVVEKETVDMVDKFMSGITTVFTVIMLILLFPLYGFRKDR